ncbi:MAG: insulinase family protein [Thiopseudomonas sp.]|nr:insulinase family protein [Thiopseudomonas sp.]
MSRLLSCLTATLLSASLLAGCATSQNNISPLASLARLDTTAPERRSLDIQHWQTRHASTVLFVPAPELPMLDIRLTFAAGSSQDGPQPGLASLTNALLDQGTTDKSADQIALGLENLGAQLSSGSYRDMGIVSLRTLSDPALSEPALQLLTEVIGQPAFRPRDIERLKNQLQAGFEHQQKDPSTLANQALFADLYGNHPYAHPSAGTPDSIRAITRDQLQDFYRRHYSAGNLHIALVGDLDRARAEQIAERISQALPQGDAVAAVAQPITPAASQRHIDFDSSQTHILLAQLALERGHPDYPALYLANQILGGSGFGSRLMEEVREKRGLTYGIYSMLNPMQAPGPFMISVQTRAELSQATLELVQQLLRDFVEYGPTADELATSKREILGSFPLSAASNSAIVGQLGAIGFYGLPLSWQDDFIRAIEQLDLATVKAAIQRHLHPDALTLITLGPQVEQLPLPAAVERSAQPTGARH